MSIANVGAGSPAETENAYTGPVPHIANIVCGVDLNCRIDIAAAPLLMRNATCNPKRFPACVIRMREPKATALVFSSGKMQVLGNTGSVDNSRLAAVKFARMLRKTGYQPRLTGFKVQNLVASVDTKMTIRLEGLHYQCMQSNAIASYEPELFPGLVFKMQQPRVCFVVFSKGKVNMLGAKTREELDLAMRKIWPLLLAHRVI